MLKEFWKESVAVIKEKDPAFKSAIEVLLYPSFWAVVNHRIAHSLYKKGLLVSARLRFTPAQPSASASLLTTAQALLSGKPQKSGIMLCCTTG